MSDLTPDEINDVSDAITGVETEDLAPPETATPPTPPAPPEAKEEVEVDDSIPTISKAQFLQLEEQVDPDQENEPDLDKIKDVEINVQIQLGQIDKTLDEILQLKPESVVELQKLAGEPVDIVVKDQLIARGEIMVHEEKMCVKVIEIAGTRKRLEEKGRGIK